MMPTLPANEGNSPRMTQDAKMRIAGIVDSSGTTTEASSILSARVFKFSIRMLRTAVTENGIQNIALTFGIPFHAISAANENTLAPSIVATTDTSLDTFLFLR